MRKLIFVTFLGIFLPVFLFLMVGCMKTPEVNKNFGPEYTANQLVDAIDNTESAVKLQSASKVKIGEFSYYVKTNQIENMYPVVFLQIADTVMSVDKTTNKINTVVQHKKSELQDNGQMKPWPETQFSDCVSLVSNGCLTTQSTLQAFLQKVKNLFKVFDIFTVKLMTTSVASTQAELTPEYGIHSEVLADLKWQTIVQRAVDATATKWTFHNLRVVNSSYPVPELVLMRVDCGKRDLKMKKCEDPLETTEVSFDQVDWTSEQFPVKYSYKMIFSREAPYYGAQIQNCGSTTIPYQQQRIALMQCETLKDFTFGHD